jgi:hypothetical protein
VTPAQIAARLLAESFADVNDDYDLLTTSERETVGTEEDFARLLAWIEENS